TCTSAIEARAVLRDPLRSHMRVESAPAGQADRPDRPGWPADGRGVGAPPRRAPRRDAAHARAAGDGAREARARDAEDERGADGAAAGARAADAPAARGAPAGRGGRAGRTEPDPARRAPHR